MDEERINRSFDDMPHSIGEYDNCGTPTFNLNSIIGNV